jgi:hypothetical protein
MVLLWVLLQNSNRRNGMKNFNIKSILIIVAASLVLTTSCAKSSEESADLQALLSFVVSKGDAPSEVEAQCLANLALANTCVGGASKGDGFPGTWCSPRTADGEEFLFVIGTHEVRTAISEKITETSCNLAANNYPAYKEAQAGAFSGVLDDDTIKEGACSRKAGTYENGACSL